MYEDDYVNEVMRKIKQDLFQKDKEQEIFTKEQEKFENKILFAGKVFMYSLGIYIIILFFVIFMYESIFSFSSWRFLDMITPDIFIPNLGEKFTISPYLLGWLNFMSFVLFGISKFILFFMALVTCNGKLRPLGKNRYNSQALLQYEFAKNYNNHKILGIKVSTYGKIFALPFCYGFLYFGHYSDLYFKSSRFELLMLYIGQIGLWIGFCVFFSQILYKMFGEKITWQDIDKFN